ncbi:MAG: hypothetical protein A4E71_02019 [Smithella sp. PtaU1.Bin162]|nr:MAG: hypothetical protein A4E71_02019 [Smithella sp. PtaU1.Bin162]
MGDRGSKKDKEKIRSKIGKAAEKKTRIELMVH